MALFKTGYQPETNTLRTGSLLGGGLVVEITTAGYKTLTQTGAYLLRLRCL